MCICIYKHFNAVVTRNTFRHKVRDWVPEELTQIHLLTTLSQSLRTVYPLKLIGDPLHSALSLKKNYYFFVKVKLPKNNFFLQFLDFRSFFYLSWYCLGICLVKLFWDSNNNFCLVYEQNTTSITTNSYFSY